VQRKTLVTSVALWLTAVGAANAADDITMQGLDDVSDVARVVSAAAGELRTSDADAKNAPRDRSAMPSASAAESPTEPASEPDQLVATLDREEESEGEIEDFDVPEDITVPEPTEDEEE
jgi:hypothetical protein